MALRRGIALVLALFAFPAIAQVLVTPAAPGPWTFNVSGGDPAAPPAAYIAPGFEMPPLPIGSAHLTTGADGNAVAQIRNTAYSGTRLDSLEALSYSTFVDVDGSGGQAPYMNLLIDQDNNGTVDDQLFFEPVYQTGSYPSSSPIPNQGTVQLHQWQTWNALAGGWWSLDAMTFGPPLVTIPDYIAMFPDARIVNSGTGAGGLRILTGNGGAAWNNFLGAVDAVTIDTTATPLTTYNFEPPPGTVVTVTPAALDGWTLQTADDGDMTNTASTTIVTGPGTPPLGDGSLQLSVGADGGDAAMARNNTYDGMLLRDLSSLIYSTYVQTPGSGGQAPYIILNVDYDGNGSTDDFLFFEPVYQTAGFFPLNPQPAIVVGAWQTWDARNGGWWSVNNTAGAGPGVNVKPIGAILDLQPDARLATDAGGSVRIVAGFGQGAWDNFLGNADALSISFASPVTTYDFEPVPTIIVSDVAQAEGTGGTTNFVFTLTLSEAVSQTVTVQYTTADGSATGADGDYGVVAAPLTATFTPGSTSTTITIAVTPDTKHEADETFFVNLANPANATIADNQATGTIQNDDAQPAISIADVSLAEGNAGPTNFVFNVTLSNPSAQTITVDFTTADNTATAPLDYQTTGGTLTFNPGVVLQQITVPVSGETVHEADETFFVNLANPTNATILDNQATGTIQNDDAQPAISIADVSLAEGNAGTTSFQFNVTLWNPSAQTITVDYTTADNTATQPGDYSTASGSLTFNPGVTLQTVTVNVNGDTLFEPDETFFVNLTNPTNATILDAQGQGTIQNDDPQPTISMDNVSLAEGNAGTTAFTFNVTLSGASQSAITVDYATADNTATQPSDYAPASGTVTFAPGDTAETIAVNVNGDVVFEGDETFFVNLTNPGGATILDGQGLGTIQNDDAMPQISISDVALAEGNASTTNFVFNVTLSGTSQSAITVDYATANNTAVAPGDYTATAGTLTFPAGNALQQITVPVAGETIFEADETFFVNLTNPTGAAILDNQATGTIQNDDAQPTITIGDVTLAEGNAGTTNFVFNVNLSNASSQTITVDYTTADNTATQPGDYGTTSGTLTFNPGVTLQQITVPVVGDTTFEPDETFFVNLTNPTNATILDNQGLGTIQNDEGVPTITISDVALAEGNGGTTNFVFNVTLSTSSATPVTVDFATADNTATQPSDYAPQSGTLTFAPGDVNESITVAVAGDTAFEPTETFFVNLTNPSGAAFADNQGLGTITNDDGVPSITIDDVSLAEGHAGTTSFTFTVTLSGPSGTPVTVDYATAHGTTIGDDYTPAAGTLTFAPGDVSETITVNVHGDNRFEGNDTFFVNLSNPNGATIADNQGLGTILNDDPQPTIAFDANSVQNEGNAGNTIYNFIVELSNPSDFPITVDYATADDTAVAGSDYAPVSGTLTFAPSVIGLGINVNAFGDTLYEINEAFFLNLSNATNATIVDNQAVGTLLNDDNPPPVVISDVTEAEGNGGITNFVFTVTLTPATGRTGTVDYATADGTAIAGSDYVATSGTLTFPSGTISRQITVQVLGDVTFEPAETFFVNLTNANGLTIADAQGTGTITTDDGPVADLTLTKTGPGTVNAGGPINYLITVSNAGPQAATNVVVTDVLPSGSTYVSATPSQGTCTGTTTVTCSLGTINNGANATIQLVVNAPMVNGPVSNTATATANEADATPPASTAVTFALGGAEIPTLSEWMLLALLMALAAAAALKLKG